MSKVPEQYAAIIRQNGDNPDDFVWDESSQQAIHASQAPSMGVGESITQVLRNIGGGAAQGLSDVAGYAGRLSKYALDPGSRQIGQTLRDVSGWGNERIKEDVYQDPRSEATTARRLLMHDLPSGLGQLTTTAIPAALTGPAAPIVGGMLGGAQMGEDTARQEESRQKRMGEQPNDTKTLAKSLAVAGLGGLVDAIFGAGSLGRLLGHGTGESVAKVAGKEFVKGAGTEAAQQGLQDAVVEGEVDAGKMGAAGLVGGILQGGMGAMAKNSGTPPELPTSEGKPPLNINMDPAKAAEEYNATHPDKPVPPRFSDVDIQTIINAPEWKPPGADAVDKAIQQAKATKITLTPERINTLASAFDGTETSKAKVNDALKSMYLEDRRVMGPKDAEEAAQNITKNLPKEIQDTTKQLAEVEKGITQVKELKAKVEAQTDFAAGDKWKIQGQYDTVLQQLEAMRAKLHTDLTSKMPEPQMAVDIPRGQGPTGARVGYSEKGMRYDLANQELSQTLPTQGLPIGDLNPTTPPDTQKSLSVREYLKQQASKQNQGLEGEQRPPFAEAGKVNTPPTPEGEGVINEQLKLTADEKSSKAATLLTPELANVDVPQGLETVSTPHGTVVFNPKKVSRKSVEVAGSGEVFDAKLLGMSGGETQGDKIVTTDMGGQKNVLAEVAQTPEAVDTAKKAQQKAAPGSEQEIRSPEEVVKNREEERHAGDVLPPEDKTYYFGADISKPLKALEKKVGMKFTPLAMLHEATKSVGDKMAAESAAGAYFRSKAESLLTKERRLANTQLQEWHKIKNELKDPRLVKWLNDTMDKGVDDYTGLPQSLVNVAKKVRTLTRQLHAIQTSEGVYVEETKNGKRTYRPPQDIESYFMFGMSPEVWRAADEGGKKWEEYKKNWLDNWKTHKDPKSPGWETEALAALNDTVGTLAGGRFEGGEPLFNAVRKAHGIPLPREWRSNDIYGSAVKYIQRWAKDIAWGTEVQNDPILRTYFGIRQDAKGVMHPDALNFDPNSKEWELAKREGEKVGADWVDEYGDGESAPINVLTNKSHKQTLIASFTGRPLGGVTTGDKVVEAANQIASAAMMQTFTGIRDVGQNVAGTFDYVKFSEIAPWFKGFVHAISDIPGGIARVKREGGMTDHPIVTEAAGVLSDAAYKTANSIRKFTLRNGLEEFSKSLAWHVFNETVLHQSKGGKLSPLVMEFGGNTTGKSKEQIAAEVANTLVNKINPDFTWRNLSASMVPQNKKFLGAMTGLMRWSVAKYNNWYSDVWRPFTQGHPDRLIRSLLVGSVATVAMQELINWLRQTKPANLTYKEWMNLPDGKKLDEFAPMFFAYHQAQGTFGILGDVAQFGANVYAGKPIARPDIRPQMPAALMLTDFLNTTYSFMKYTKEVGLNLHDLGAYGMELAKFNQNIRALDNIKNKDKKPDTRDEKLFEDLYGLSAKTGEPKVSSAYREYISTPFSLGKEVNRMETADDVRRLYPALIERAKRGEALPPIRHHMNSPIYYGYLSRMYGQDEALRRLQKDKGEEDKSEMRRSLLDPLK